MLVALIRLQLDLCNLATVIQAYNASLPQSHLEGCAFFSFDHTDAKAVGLPRIEERSAVDAGVCLKVLSYVERVGGQGARYLKFHFVACVRKIYWAMIAMG